LTQLRQSIDIPVKMKEALQMKLSAQVVGQPQLPQ
jgi:hypothetical protein